MFAGWDRTACMRRSSPTLWFASGIVGEQRTVGARVCVGGWLARRGWADCRGIDRRRRGASAASFAGVVLCRAFCSDPSSGGSRIGRWLSAWVGRAAGVAPPRLSSFSERDCGNDQTGERVGP